MRVVGPFQTGASFQLGSAELRAGRYEGQMLDAGSRSVTCP